MPLNRKEIEKPLTTEEDLRCNQQGAELVDTLKPAVQQMLADEINEIRLYGGVRKKVPISNTEVVKLGLEFQESEVRKTVNLNIVSRRRVLDRRPGYELDKYRISFLFNPDTNTLEYDKAFFYWDYAIIPPPKFKRLKPPTILEPGWVKASSNVGPEERILRIAIEALANLPGQ